MGKLTLPVAVAVMLCGRGSCALAQAGLDAEVRQLKAQLASQQEQIDALRRLVEAQGRLLAGAPPAAAPVAPARSEAREVPKPATSIQLGGISFTPTGFLEYSQVWRSRTVSSGLPTNFASIPFNNTVEGNRKQTLGTAASTRLGVQMNTNAFGVRLLGVVEADFLGFQPGNISTTTNSYGMRLRLAFVDVQKGRWEFLGGQDWSLLTPGRKGIAPTPAGLMLTQDLDPNNQSGLIWARPPQARVVYKPSDQIAFGASFESGEPYAGGSGGAGAVILPSALAPNYFNQVDTGSGGLAVPNPHLDFTAKAAFDPKKLGRGTHIEVGALVTRPSFYNPITATRFATTGGGVSLNASSDITGRLTLFTNNFYGEGGGRMIFGEAPALIIVGDGSPSLVRSMSMVQGLELQAASKLKFWAYYGGTYIDNTVALDPANGQLVGYGYSGSPGSHNRTIQEVTGGFTRVFWRDPNYGALQVSGQYSWVVRHPWSVGSGQPGSANLNMLYLGIRFVLPAATGK